MWHFFPKITPVWRLPLFGEIGIRTRLISRRHNTQQYLSMENDAEQEINPIFVFVFFLSVSYVFLSLFLYLYHCICIFVSRQYVGQDSKEKAPPLHLFLRTPKVKMSPSAMQAKSGQYWLFYQYKSNYFAKFFRCFAKHIIYSKQISLLFFLFSGSAV